MFSSEGWQMQKYCLAACIKICYFGARLYMMFGFLHLLEVEIVEKNYMAPLSYTSEAY